MIKNSLLLLLRRKKWLSGNGGQWAAHRSEFSLKQAAEEIEQARFL